MTEALTPQAKLDLVRQAVIAANPDILKPQRGSRIRRKRNDKEGFIVTDFFTVDFCTCCYVMYDNEAGYTHMAQYPEFTLPEGHQHYDLKIDVLGRPIRLADVLLALRVNKPELNPLRQMVQDWPTTEHHPLYWEQGAIKRWNLHRDSLDDQDATTTDFLHSLLSPKKP